MNKIENIFITSTYRSGASLFTKMLSVNKKIKISSSVVNFFRYYYKKNNNIKNEKNLNILLRQFCFRLKYRHGINLNFDQIKSELNKDNYNFSNLYTLFCSKVFSNNNFILTGEHAVNEWRNISKFLKLFPNGKAIIILRDPRDIVCSFKKTTIAKKSNYLISLFNFVDLVNYAFNLKKKYKSKIHIIKFHELKKNPNRILKKVCKFLKIKYEPKMSDEKKLKDLDGKKWDQSKIYSFSGKLKKKNINRWKSIIEIEDLYLSEYIAKKQMQMSGFKLSNTKFKKKTIEKSLKKIKSSKLLKNSFLNWIKHKKGNDNFPLDPLNSKNYDKKEFKNPGKYFSKINN